MVGLGKGRDGGGGGGGVVAVQEVVMARRCPAWLCVAWRHPTAPPLRHYHVTIAHPASPGTVTARGDCMCCHSNEITYLEGLETPECQYQNNVLFLAATRSLTLETVCSLRHNFLFFPAVQTYTATLR